MAEQPASRTFTDNDERALRNAIMWVLKNPLDDGGTRKVVIRDWRLLKEKTRKEIRRAMLQNWRSIFHGDEAAFDEWEVIAHLPVSDEECRFL